MFHGIPRESIAQLLYPMTKSSENLWKFFGRARKSPWISENFGNASNPLLRSLNDLWNFWKTSETVQKCLPDVFMIFLNFRKIFGNLGSVRKFSEIFGKLRKRFKSNFQVFLWFFKVFGKSSEIFGSAYKIFRKFPDVIGNVRNSSTVLVLAFEKSSNGP